MEKVPGRRETFQYPSPLRTVRASLPAHGSSLSNALSIRTRFLHRNIQVMNLLMAIGMKKDPIACQITASFRSPDDVVAVPAGLCGDLLGADWADPLLRFPQVQQLLSASQRAAHLGSQSLLEVRLPDRIIRVGMRSDLDVSPNGYL